MSWVLSDRTQETTTTGGTGTITLLGPCFSCISFFYGVGVGNSTYYTIVDKDSGDWEVGYGTLVTATTLSRTTVFSSSNNDLIVTFAANNIKNVFTVLPAEKTIVADPSGNVKIPHNLQINTVPYQFPNIQGGASTHLQNDGVGNLTWVGGGGGTVTSVDVSGGTTGLTTSGGPITTAGTITLAGTLDVASGGTGVTSLTHNEVVVGDGVFPLFTISNAFTAGVPLVSTGHITPPAFGTAVVAGGGTGLGSLTANAVLLGEGNSPVGFAAPVTAGYVLTDNGPGVDPTFQLLPSGGSMAIGTAVIGGTPNYILFIDPSGNLGQDIHFQYSTAAGLIYTNPQPATFNGSYFDTLGDLILASGATLFNFTGSFQVSALGGTTTSSLTLTGSTPGNVLFVGPSAVSESPNLAWDNTNQTLTVLGNGTNNAINTINGVFTANLAAPIDEAAGFFNYSSFTAQLALHAGIDAAGYLQDGTRVVEICNGSQAINAIGGPIQVPGTSGQSFQWGANTTPTSNTNTVASLPLNTYGAGGTAVLTDPDQWLLVNVGGTDYKIPAWVV